ncbi:MAG: 50S ribosomal protein L11 methyltransferase [Clostridiaceae bacterium]|nr:50S ribosomal protein L11 methyltransferase [Clostridiaceae bacterium]
MNWLEVTVTIEPKWQDIISEIFIELGIQGIEIVDPEDFRKVLKESRYTDYAADDFLRNLGDNMIIRAYFSADDKDCLSLREKLNEAFERYSVSPLPVIEIRERDDSEWKDNWKKYYKTFQISERVIVKPSWEDYNPPADKVVIELDPGMAFGTGTHETTRLCAAMLDAIVKGGEKVLDLGCGTGILGIIAAKLGARSVTCADIDEIACRTAIENIRNNGVEQKVAVVHGTLNDIKRVQYDIIAINIITDVILSLLPLLHPYCTDNTNIVLSGITRERKNEITEAVIKSGYRIIQELFDGEWMAVRICPGS